MNADRFAYFAFPCFCLVLAAFSVISCSRHVSPEKKLEKKERKTWIFSAASPEEKKLSPPEREVLSIFAEQDVPKIKQERAKKLFPMGTYRLSPKTSSPRISSETVEIGGKKYCIPSPWVGRKLVPPVFTRDSFARIPRQYVHGGRDAYVRKEVLDPLLTMIAAASLDGVSLLVESAYRDPEAQKAIFLRKFREGRTWNDVVRYVAPPGYSEHMLGLAIDFFPSGWKFAHKEEYRWLQEHGKEYGFMESYPRSPRPGHARIAWESWHWLYIGQRD